jgi:TfoX/Sxy family transcriptional regulator of competence genes
MGYDKGLADRVRALLEGKPGFSEKNMFGGVCFLLRGNMACGVLNDDLIVRVGPEKYKEALQMRYTRKFDITGRPMKGWVIVSAEGHKKKRELVAWVERGAAFALTLPTK